MGRQDRHGRPLRPGLEHLLPQEHQCLGPPDLVFRFGAAGLGYLPLAGDWDRDGIDTTGVYVAGGRNFFLRNANTTGVGEVNSTYGPAGATPIVGNWDGL